MHGDGRPARDGVVWQIHAADPRAQHSGSPQDPGSGLPAPFILTFSCCCVFKETSSESHHEPKSLPLPKLTRLLLPHDTSEFLTHLDMPWVGRPTGELRWIR